LDYEEYLEESPAEKVKKVLFKYREICDLRVKLDGKSGVFECMKVGAKTQFSIDQFYEP